MPSAEIDHPPLRRSLLQKAVFLSCVGAAVFFLPYLVPVSPSLSLSYIAGFNNRAATVLFVLGIALFAVFTQGEIAPMEETKDRSISVTTLLISLLVILLLCLARAYTSTHGSPGQEAFYAINRQHMLAAGLAPYSQFEFLYGPLLIYPGFLIARVLHISQEAGYFTSWIIEWIVGTIFLWSVVRSLDFCLRYRLYVYAALLLLECLAINLVGLNYTPFRAYSAAFLIFVAHSVWKRTRNPWKTALASIIATACAIAISMEQGMGVAIGIAGYLLLLSWSSRSKFPRAALGLVLVGCAACFAVAARAHLFLTPRTFASGGLNFPLLPSAATCLILFIYVVAGTVLCRYIRSGHLDSVAIPLVIAGFAMLPSAFGRCDLGHLLSATPAMVVGVAAISAMPSIRRWWFTLTFLALFVIPPLLGMRGTPLGHRIKRALSGHTTKVVQTPVDSSKAIAPAALAPGAPPCDRRYFSPFYVPWLVKSDPKCLDTGYYLGPWTVTTPEGIARKIDEMRQRPSEPLLLSSDPLEKQFTVDDYETNMASLYTLEDAYVLPRAKHAPLTLEPVVVYIRSHYVPGPVIDRWRLQIWYPKDTTVH